MNGEHSLIMTVYNLKRCLNILGIAQMLEKIKNWNPNYKEIAWLIKKQQKCTNFEALHAIKILEIKSAA